MSKPNLFKIATKELSQDALLTWLLQWSSPENKTFDIKLHECGTSLLRLLMKASEHYKNKTLIQIKAGRQWDGIDIWAELYFSDNKKTLLIIEDKTHSSEHSDQLKRYKDQSDVWAKENDFEEVICTFIKIGGEAQRLLKAIEAKGYQVFDRASILDCLLPFRNVGSSIIDDFTDHLQDLQLAYNAFQHLKLKDWDGSAWVGFYQFVESRIDINMWHWVNNPSGGFWNLCLTWDYWENYPVYMQIEQGRLCFKIAFAEDETGLDNNDQGRRAIQDEVQQHLLAFAAKKEMNIIERPYPYVHRGNYRTFAVIAEDNWRGESMEILDRETVIEKLKHYNSFYHEFIAHLKALN